MCREWLCELGRWGMAALRRWLEHRINDGRYGRRTVPAGGAVNTRHQEGSKLSRFKEQRKGQCLRNIVDEENGSGWGVRDRWGDDRPKHTEGDSIQAGDSGGESQRGKQREKVRQKESLSGNTSTATMVKGSMALPTRTGYIHTCQLPTRLHQSQI